MALTVQAGNILDKQHFQITFKRTLKALNEGSLIIVDRGANTQDNKTLIRKYHHHYLCGATLSKKIDEKIRLFDKQKTFVAEEKQGQSDVSQLPHRDGEGRFLRSEPSSALQVPAMRETVL